MNERPLADRVALVTGSARGIGYAIAETLARDGCAVALHARALTPRLAQRAEEIGRRFGVPTAALAADLATGQGVEKLVAAFDGAFARIDILVNNAGYETTHAAEDMPEADWRGVLEVNLTAPFLLAQAAARRMKERGGVVINISSMHDEVPRKGLSHYTAAKAGLRMLGRTLAIEWAEYGIRVVTVSPGAIETDMNRDAIEAFGRARFNEWIPAGHVGVAADVAEAVAFLCSDKASYITGTELVIDGGYMRNLVRYDDRPGRGRE
jgi:glucose 1-dehydrogenase